MDAQVEEVKAKTDIVAVIGQRIKLAKAGRNLKGLCPFHGEKSPSFMVSPERGTWHCFGCGEHGDVFTFLEKYENLTFPEALDQLAKQAGIELVKTGNQKNLNSSNTQRLYDLLELTAKYYQYILTQHPLGKEAREYIDKRSINKEMSTKFMLGFAPNSWQSLGNFLHQKGFSDKEIAQAGISSSNERGRTYDRFRGRLMFPVTDSMGRVVGFSGRALIDQPNTPKYLNSPEGELFHKGRLLYGLSQARDDIRANQRLVLVEGNIDVISSAQSGVTEVAAPLGTALTIEQVNVLKRFTQKVYIAFDSDKAGQEAVRRSLALFKDTDLEVRVIKIPSGKDPDELIKSDPQAWVRAIDQAKEVFDFYLEWATTNFNLNSERGQQQAIQELAPLVQQAANPVTRAFLIKKMSDALGSTEQVVKSALRRPPAIASRSTTARSSSTASKLSRSEVLARHLVSQLLTMPVEDSGSPEIQQVLPKLLPEAILDPNLRVIMEAIKTSLADKHQVDLNHIASKLSDQALLEFDHLSLGQVTSEPAEIISEDIIDQGLTNTGTIDANYAQNLEDLRNCIWDLNYLYLDAQLKAIEKQQKQAQALQQPNQDLRKKTVQLTTEKLKWQRK